MIKKILIGFGALVLLALILVGARYLYTSSEKDGSSDTAEAATADNTGVEKEEQDDPEATVSGSEVAESTDVSGNAVTAEDEEADAMAGEETAEDEDADATGENAAEEVVASSENGILYTINTNAGNNLGMVPIVGGNAVILMDGGNASTYQGNYEPEEQSALNLKVEEVTAAAVSGGKIEAWAFYREANLRDFTFPDDVAAIEKFAFARSNLSSISIPEGVTRIGYGAFYHCDALSVVVIPDSVTVIEENAFSHTPWLDNWLAGGGEEETTETSESDDFLVVGDGVLLAYRGNEKNPVLPETVKSIVPGALGE